MILVQNYNVSKFSFSPTSREIHRKLDDVHYFSIPETEKSYFRCDRYAVTLSTSACAASWEKSQGSDGEKNEGKDGCRLCVIGAGHAGREIKRLSKYYGTQICPRCRRGGLRLIAGTRCVSCYNREREVLVGRNSKGTCPKKHKRLHPIQISYTVNGGLVNKKTAPAQDILERFIAVLRSTKGKVVFGFNGATLRNGCEVVR